MFRIIGISPVVYAENPVTGDIIGTRNLFWLYFPQCRYHFSKTIVSITVEMKLK